MDCDPHRGQVRWSPNEELARPRAVVFAAGRRPFGPTEERDAPVPPVDVANRAEEPAARRGEVVRERETIRESNALDLDGLPDSLLSRFDLLFIVLDKMDPEIDSRLASHVLKSHLYRKPGESDGQAMRIDTAGDTVIVEPQEVRLVMWVPAAESTVIA